MTILEVGDPHYDDPSLALLFSQLKLKSLQTAKGTSEISGRTEFNFVLQMARVFCRMGEYASNVTFQYIMKAVYTGCHVLALDLTTSWSFERPARHRRRPSTIEGVTNRLPSISPTKRRFDPYARRKSSIIIDMAIPSLPPSEPSSPTHQQWQMTAIERTSKPPQRAEGDMHGSDRHAGLGNLMMTAKQDVSVPEFDMNAFFS